MFNPRVRRSHFARQSFTLDRMRWVALMGVALFAACEQAGVQFIVEIPADYGRDGDPQVQLPDEVRLFIGLGEETPTMIAPEGFEVGQARPGTYWLRDPSNLGPEVDRAPIGVDSPAVFSYTSGGDVQELGVVIAVGYTRGEPTSSVAEFHAKVGSDRVYRYRMGLNGAADPRDPVLRTRVNQLEVWGSSECVFADNRREDLEDSSHKVAFIIGSADDRDCDGLLDSDPLECFEQVHKGVGPSTRPSCMHNNQLTKNCTVGVPRCRDGSGEDQSCNPSRFCLPPQVCEYCDNSLDPWSCAQNYAAETASIGNYGLKCILPVREASGGGFELCEPTTDITVEIRPPLGASCEDVAVKSTGDPAFSDTFSLVGPGNTATVKISHSGCTLKVKPRGALAASVAVDGYAALMMVALDQRRGIAVPVFIEVSGPAACVSDGVCTWVDQMDPINPNNPTNPDACVASMTP